MNSPKPPKGPLPHYGDYTDILSPNHPYWKQLEKEKAVPQDDIFIKFKTEFEMVPDLGQNTITIPISMDRVWAKSLLQLVERKDACFENIKKAADSQRTADSPKAYLEAKQMEASYQEDYNKLVLKIDEYRINLGGAVMSALLERMR